MATLEKYTYQKYPEGFVEESYLDMNISCNENMRLEIRDASGIIMVKIIQKIENEWGSRVCNIDFKDKEEIKDLISALVILEKFEK